MKLPISAIVVSCDEGHLLDACLSSLFFCKEIIVVNMESRDDTERMAKKYQTVLIQYPRVSVVEYARKELIHQCKNDWVLFIDPDEKVAMNLVENLTEVFKNERLDRIGMIALPWQFYFKNKALRGTVWGGERYKKSLLHKHRVDLNHFVHRGTTILPEFQIFTIQKQNENHLQHYWMMSFQQLFSKHRRYLNEEGESQYAAGVRYSFGQQWKATLFAFKHSFYNKKGYQDHYIGFLLSLFWMWYVYQKWNALKRYSLAQR